MEAPQPPVYFALRPIPRQVSVLPASCSLHSAIARVIYALVMGGALFFLKPSRGSTWVPMRDR